ncbi:hypothetical protein BJ170DRAFT_677411 [Xylariales sp. AK1849]|nr:hypothetical protein BJ170DRAFT_677411 [Xylariales sp. AK1849]
MATNSGRGNPIAAEEGPSKVGEGAPPPVSQETKSAVAGQTDTDGAGVHAAGEDATTAPTETTVKPAKEGT